MEQIGGDIQNLISRNLSGQDMIRLCSTSTKLRKQCSSFGMRSYWKDQINKDFSVDYNDTDPYQEYLRLTWLDSQKLYLAYKYNQRHGGETEIVGIYISEELAHEAIKLHMIHTFYDPEEILKVYEDLKGDEEYKEAWLYDEIVYNIVRLDVNDITNYI